MLNGPTESVRRELLLLDGIGKETADSILVFGSLTRREDRGGCVFGQNPPEDWSVRSEDYDEIQSFVESNLKGGPKGFHDLYALMVQLSKDTCRPVPSCTRCSLGSECKFFTEQRRR